MRFCFPRDDHRYGKCTFSSFTRKKKKKKPKPLQTETLKIKLYFPEGFAILTSKSCCFFLFYSFFFTVLNAHSIADGKAKQLELLESNNLFPVCLKSI